VLSEAAADGKRLRVAVVPEQFPRAAGDIAGIFARDYVEAIRPFCDVVVVVSGSEDRRGVTRHVPFEDGVEYVICTPLVRGAGSRMQRFGRLEVLLRLQQAAPLLRHVDLIHAHGAIFHGAPAARLGKRLRIPVVLTIHTGPFEKLLRRRATRILTRRTLERVDCVCAVSEDVRHRIERAGIRPKRLEVSYNPVDTNLFRPAAATKPSSRRMTFGGRLEEYKGGLRVARAFASVADRLPGWTLTIAGEGPERHAIRDFVDATPALAARVELLGAYTKAEFADLLAASDFFVYPSRYESFGLAIAEAMAAGLPVVAPDRTAPAEFVDQRSGVLVPPDDINAIANAMEHIAKHLSQFDQNVIRQTIVDRFGFEVFGQRLLALYRSLIISRHARGDLSCAD
jgi:glycosyltransferase involved in cell wall biosynthesis